jgi:hypothetical protein
MAEPRPAAANMTPTAMAVPVTISAIRLGFTLLYSSKNQSKH